MHFRLMHAFSGLRAARLAVETDRVMVNPALPFDVLECEKQDLGSVCDWLIDRLIDVSAVSCGLTIVFTRLSPTESVPVTIRKAENFHNFMHRFVEHIKVCV